MKRWNFRGLPASHGTSLTHRSAGSTGQNQVCFYSNVHIFFIAPTFLLYIIHYNRTQEKFSKEKRWRVGLEVTVRRF